jgi:hypothetical protein
MIAVLGIVTAGCGGGTEDTTTSAVVTKDVLLRSTSKCEVIPDGTAGHRVAKLWLLRIEVVQVAERLHKGLAARNATELQAYCRSHPSTTLDRATPRILHADPANGGG